MLNSTWSKDNVSLLFNLDLFLQESRDPRRIHRFLEMLLEEPLNDQRGSFSDSR